MEYKKSAKRARTTRQGEDRLLFRAAQQWIRPRKYFYKVDKNLIKNSGGNLFKIDKYEMDKIQFLELITMHGGHMRMKTNYIEWIYNFIFIE